MNLKCILTAVLGLSIGFAWAQRIDPAPIFKLPELKTKKLKRNKNDGWKLPGYEVTFSNVFFGLATNEEGQQVFLKRYPETDIATGVIILDADLTNPKPDGLAIFLSPDGLRYQAGSFRQNKPHGPWISVSMKPLSEPCLTLTFETKPDEVEEKLKKCHPDSAQQASIKILKANYTNGKLDGPATRSTLSGGITQSLAYSNGDPIGEEVNSYYWKTPSFTAVHGASISDTTFAEITKEPIKNEISKRSERMPAFISPDCPSLNPATCTSEEMDEYQKCTTKAMLMYIYTNIRYPRSSRENGVDGMNVTTFVVEKDGSLTGVRTVRHVSGPLDKESRRLIRSMPRWSPGMQDGEPVRVQFNLPVRFRLE